MVRAGAWPCMVRRGRRDLFRRSVRIASAGIVRPGEYSVNGPPGFLFTVRRAAPVRVLCSCRPRREDSLSRAGPCLRPRGSVDGTRAAGLFCFPGPRAFPVRQGFTSIRRRVIGVSAAGLAFPGCVLFGALPPGWSAFPVLVLDVAGLTFFSNVSIFFVLSKLLLTCYT